MRKPIYMLSYFKSFSEPKDPYEEMYQIIKYSNKIDIQAVTKYIEILKCQGRVDERCKSSGETLLMLAFLQEAYKIAILLLEAGSNPHLLYTNCKGLTILHDYILYKKFPQIRLLLWYGPDYKNIRNNTGEKETAEKRIENWDWHLRNTKRSGIKDNVDKIVKDGIRVRELMIGAEKYYFEQEHFKLINIYQEIARIYYEQWEIEKSIKASDYSYRADKPFDCIEKEKAEEDFNCFKRAATHFYGSKSYLYYQKAEELCASLKKNALFYSEELKKQHKDILEHLLKLSKVTGDQAQEIAYAKIMADLILDSKIEKPNDSESKENRETEERKENDEFEPLLTTSFGLRKRTTLGQSEKPSLGKIGNRV